MTAQTINVLIVEDSADDALLLERHLRRGGLKVTAQRVDSAQTLRAALGLGTWDVVITDHNMPGFDAEAAVAVVREADPDLPVIIVSGSIGEDIAVAAMKAGAADYIMKDHLARLVPAVERELREAALRRQHRAAEAAIRHMAFHDSLTGLMNRPGFEARLRQALSGPGPHALLYLDLDQFKVVNDTCGHTAGDALLRALAPVLKAAVRPQDTVARLGGDEFGILLGHCPLAEAERIGARVLAALNAFCFRWESQSFTLGGSMGVVPIGEGPTTLSELMRQADIACYAAKDLGRNRLHVYSPEDVDLARRQGEMQWVARIGAALAENRFVLYRQSILPLRDDCTAPQGCEILIRMRDEAGELVMPGVFLPAAERYNLAPAIDRWVVHHLLAAVSRARTQGLAVPGQFFINISGTTLNDPDFFAFVEEERARAGVPAQELCFEITETAAVANLGRAVEFIEGLRRLGYQFALDDFGTGMSSFSYLKALPVDAIKIDGHFVRSILDSPMDRAIVESVNRVAHVVGLTTIAEFVESDAVRRELVTLGVNYGQGWGLHRPEPMGGCGAPPRA